jgi:serine/threonine-protein kinase HipA
VYVDVDVEAAPLRAGIAYFTHGRQRVTTTFAYDPSYLADARSFDLEPALPRQSGQQYIDGLPGCFQDSAPDRWGRNLIDKRRRAQQRQATRRLPAATTVDYLAGVSDLTRQGDLRYAAVDGGPFLDPGHTVPKLVSLSRLLAAADRAVADPDDFAAVKELLDAGSGSLGGARPKASVRADDGRLLIAKFPHRDDAWNVMAWEKSALDLAEDAGIHVPGRRLTTVGDRSVLLLDRFDRGPGGRRVGYLSAMSLLGARDGEDADYLDIAEVLPEHGARVADDLTELYRRVVFSVAMHNTDDHLRNHGFVRRPGGWRLSPLFDVNPDPDPGTTRVTSIAGAVAADDEPDALLELATECRLSEERARRVAGEVHAAVRRWREVALRNGIGKAEQDRFADALDGQLTALASLTR